MPYADDETSISDGEPVELYEFIGPVTRYRYTSGTTASSYNGNVYEPTPIKRSSAGANSTVDPAALNVTLPADSDVAIAYGFNNPPRSLELRVYRIQTRSGDAREIWRGVAVSFSTSGRFATIRVSSKVGDRLGTAIPSVSVQRLCNHFLYDDRCQVNRNSFSRVTSVVSVDGKQITVASVGAAPDSWYRAGEIIRGVDGERRLIVSQTDETLELGAPFRALLPGDSVTLYAGCTHTIGTCLVKFNNVVNFGGHPHVPASNPFAMHLRLMKDS